MINSKRLNLSPNQREGNLPVLLASAGPKRYEYIFVGTPRRRTLCPVFHNNFRIDRRMQTANSYAARYYSDRNFQLLGGASSVSVRASPSWSPSSSGRSASSATRVTGSGNTSWTSVKNKSVSIRLPNLSRAVKSKTISVNL